MMALEGKPPKVAHFKHPSRFLEPLKGALRFQIKPFQALASAAFGAIGVLLGQIDSDFPDE